MTTASIQPTRQSGALHPKSTPFLKLIRASGSVHIHYSRKQQTPTIGIHVSGPLYVDKGAGCMDKVGSAA